MCAFKTVKQFADAVGQISEPLIRATIRQIGGWQEFKERAADIARYGADGGYNGFIYYTDTIRFFGRNQAAIVKFAEEQARDYGNAGVIEMISGFKYLRGKSTNDEIGRTLYGTKSKFDTDVANTLAWYILEEVARAYCDQVDD